MVPCLGYGNERCGIPCRGPRCPTHTRMQRAKYSRTAGHPQLRADWEPTVATGTVICARFPTDPDCDGLIAADDDWDLDHIDGTSKPSHSVCNRRAGGQGG